jgi:hypothetical protein
MRQHSLPTYLELSFVYRCLLLYALRTQTSVARAITVV